MKTLKFGCRLPGGEGARDFRDIPYFQGTIWKDPFPQNLQKVSTKQNHNWKILGCVAIMLSQIFSQHPCLNCLCTALSLPDLATEQRSHAGHSDSYARLAKQKLWHHGNIGKHESAAVELPWNSCRMPIHTGSEFG